MSDKPYKVPAEGRGALSVLHGRSRLHGRQVDPGRRVPPGQPRPWCITSSSVVQSAGRRPQERRRRALRVAHGHGARRPSADAAARAMAKLIPAGSKLVFQMHYTPNGTAQTDRSSVGFMFADPATVKKQVGTDKAGDTNGSSFRRATSNHRVEATHTLRPRYAAAGAVPAHAPARQVVPLRRRSIPTARREMLLDVPHYDFNWQNGYALAEPKLHAGRHASCTARPHFDNSDEEPGQSRSDQDGPLGRPDVGRDDDRLLRHGPGRSGSARSRSKRRTDEFLKQAGSRQGVASATS